METPGDKNKALNNNSESSSRQTQLHQKTPKADQREELT